MDTSTLLPLGLALLAGLALGALIGLLWARDRARSEQHADQRAALEQRAQDQAQVRHGLDQLLVGVQNLDRQRAAWEAQLAEQVRGMQHTTDVLRQETRGLATALRRPQVRGRWGELQLRRTVELAGLVEHCDFDEQRQLEGGTLRPDLVVTMSGGREVAVDSKVSLDAFLDYCEAGDEDERAAHLARHARQVRSHVDQLAGKQYWTALDSSPEMVVLFMASEASLQAALDHDRTLIEHASQRNVVLATPTILIALLRAVALGWRHEALADQTRQMHGLALEVFERLGTMTGHLDGVGKALASAVKAYNSTVGSLESRLMVTGRRLGEIASPDTELTSPRQVETSPRLLSLATEDNDSSPARRAHGA